MKIRKEITAHQFLENKVPAKVFRYLLVEAGSPTTVSRHIYSSRKNRDADPYIRNIFNQLEEYGIIEKAGKESTPPVLRKTGKNRKKVPFSKKTDAYHAGQSFFLSCVKEEISDQRNASKEAKKLLAPSKTKQEFIEKIREHSKLKPFSFDIELDEETKTVLKNYLNQLGIFFIAASEEHPSIAFRKRLVEDLSKDAVLLSNPEEAEKTGSPLIKDFLAKGCSRKLPFFKLLALYLPSTALALVGASQTEPKTRVAFTGR